MSKRQHLRGAPSVDRPKPVQTLQGMRAAALANAYDSRQGRIPKLASGLVRVTEGGWRFLLSYDQACSMWMFSAQLDPIRNTTVDDWRFLGNATRLVGVPPNVDPIGDTVRTAPEAVHKWLWFDADQAAARAKGRGS